MTLSPRRLSALFTLILFFWAGSPSAGTRYIEYKHESIHAHLTVGKIHKLVFPEEIVDIFVPSGSKVSVVHKKGYVYIKPLVPFEGVFLLEGVGRNTYEIAVKADNETSYTIFKILNEGISKASLKEAPEPPYGATPSGSVGSSLAGDRSKSSTTLPPSKTSPRTRWGSVRVSCGTSGNLAFWANKQSGPRKACTGSFT